MLDDLIEAAHTAAVSLRYILGDLAAAGLALWCLANLAVALMALTAVGAANSRQR